MKLLPNILLITFALTSFCCCETNEDLVEIANKAFLARNNAGGLTNKEEAVKAFSNEFQDLEDAQRLKALVLYLYDIDKSDSRWSMSSSIFMGVAYALSDDPKFVSNWSSLRSMLASEKNPRKFFLLSRIASMAKSPDNDFVAERTHMLFADGRVAKEEGEYTKAYAHDVSLYAYSAIVANLKALDAEFAPPPRTLPHEEQALILAKWLKEHWPGCGDLVMPTVARNKKDRDAPDLRNPNGQGLGDQRAERCEKERGNVTVRYIVAGLAALLAFAAAWFGLRRTKSGR